MDQPIKIEKKITDTFSFDTSRIFNNFGNLCLAQHNQSLAIELYRRAYELSTQESKASDLYKAIAIGNLGIVESRLHNFFNAERHHNESISIIIKYFQHNHPEGTHLASAINNKAICYYLKGDYELASRAFLIALEIFQQSFAQIYQDEHRYLHPDYGLCCYNIGLCYIKLNKEDTAKRYLSSAKNIFEHFELDHYKNLTDMKLHQLANTNTDPDAPRARL